MDMKLHPSHEGSQAVPHSDDRRPNCADPDEEGETEAPLGEEVVSILNRRFHRDHAYIEGLKVRADFPKLFIHF